MKTKFKPEFKNPDDRRQAMNDGIKYEDMIVMEDAKEEFEENRISKEIEDENKREDDE